MRYLPTALTLRYERIYLSLYYCLQVMKDMEASAHDINVLMAFSRSLNRRIETLENSSKKWVSVLDVCPNISLFAFIVFLFAR